jgi:hypothetical protein
VLFRIDSGDEERHLAFAVDPESSTVVSAGILGLSVSAQGWTVRTSAALDGPSSFAHGSHQSEGPA